MTGIDTTAIRAALGAVSAASTEPCAALDAVLDLACSAVRARSGTIWLPAGELLQPLVERDGEHHPTPVPARRVRALACIAANETRCMPLPRIDGALEGATVLVPLHRDKRAVGVLELTWIDLEQPDAQTLEMVEIMAGICEVASGREGAMDSTAPSAHDLLHVTQHDALTGLPNRTLLTALLQDQVEKPGEHAALLLIDLSRFKDINDTLGHRFGDALVQEIAARLQTIAHPGDVVARLGGDEFALLLPGCDEAEAAAIARHILAVLDMPCILEDRSIDVSAGLGIALFPDHGVEMETLLRRADVAMYAAKATGGGYAFYSPDQDRHNLARLTMTGELHQALAHDQFFLVYQPLLEIPGGDLHGMEALVRWHHPERGVIPPDQFIPLAEQTGLIGLLTLWVMEAALRQAQAWRAAGYRTTIAVNMSMRTLHDPQLNETLAWLLRRYEIPAATLLLEITESTLMADPARALGGADTSL